MNIIKILKEIEAYYKRTRHVGYTWIEINGIAARLKGKPQGEYGTSCVVVAATRDQGLILSRKISEETDGMLPDVITLYNIEAGCLESFMTPFIFTHDALREIFLGSLQGIESLREAAPL